MPFDVITIIIIIIIEVSFKKSGIVPFDVITIIITIIEVSKKILNCAFRCSNYYHYY